MNPVLIVDDDAGCRQLLRRFIGRADVTVAEAISAEQALLIASTEPPNIALCDVNLPGGQNGFWLATELHRLCPATVVIMTTGVQQFEAAVAGLRAGVRDYLVKPFTPGHLREAFAAGLVEHRARAARADVARGSSSDISRGLAALDAIVTSEAPGMAAHSRRVGEFAVSIAVAMGASESDQRDIEKAARLRDVARPEVHAATRAIAVLGAAEEIALASGETFDGTGLPLGLKGVEIPLGGRILAAAAAFNEVIADRSRGRSASPCAMDVLRGPRAHEFDPAVLNALDRVLSNGRRL